MNSDDKSDLTYWYYKDAIIPPDCDVIVQQMISQNTNAVEAEVEKNGSSVLDKEIRNVSKIEIPVYAGVGALLTAVGIDANSQRWNFAITRANQCELLTYPMGGRYKGHIDIILTTEQENVYACRKLTVLAFLNDDFEGGKFFLQIGPERLYPPQEKGTILVFPSFLYHGVEDITMGTRYSAVCWLIGPWLK